MSELGRARDTEALDQRWRVRWHDYLPAAGLTVVMVIARITHSAPNEMSSWGVSAVALAQGRYETMPLHMFAHGGVFHLLMNSLGLLEIGGLVTARLGSFPKGWARMALAYGVAGLFSMIFYLSFRPQGNVPMIGASGAIYGLVGLLLGIRLLEELEDVEWRRFPAAMVSFVRNNVLFLALLLVGLALASHGTRVAWEGQLGGFLFGLCVGPWLLPTSYLEPDRTVHLSD